jgi:hypothetical protein
MRFELQPEKTVGQGHGFGHCVNLRMNLASFGGGRDASMAGTASDLFAKEWPSVNRSSEEKCAASPPYSHLKNVLVEGQEFSKYLSGVCQLPAWLSF